MLDDLFSSSKGPGFIGLILGLLVLAGFCGLGFAVFDGRLNGDFANDLKSQHNKNEVKIANHKERILKFEGRMEGRAQRKVDARKLGAAKLTLKRLQDRAEALQGEDGELAQWEAKIAGVKKEWEDYRGEYRLVAAGRMVGTTFPTLTTSDGKEYADVTVKKVTALEMSVGHKNGGGSIKLAVLPAHLQDLLQFDAEVAQGVQDKLVAAAKEFDVAADLREEYNKITKERRIHVDAIKGLEKKVRNNQTQIANNKRSAMSLAVKARNEWEKYSADKAAGRAGASRADDRARAAEKQADQAKNHSRSLQSEISKIGREISETKGKIGVIDRRLKEMASEVERRKAEKATSAASGSE